MSPAELPPEQTSQAAWYGPEMAKRTVALADAIAARA